MSIVTECFLETVPEKFNSKLIELYSSPYSTLEYNKAFGNVEHPISCFCIYEGNKLVQLFIFKILKKSKKVHILNRLVVIESKYLKCFSEYIFQSTINVNSIKINHLTNQITQNSLAFSICKPFDEDYILKLPNSISEYLSKLSPHMRRHTKNYISRIERTFEGYSFSVFEKKEIPKKVINKIVEMNHLRMNNKKIVSGIDNRYTENIIKFAQDYGFISILELDNKIVAGLITYSINSNYFVEEISSDPEYDKFNVGHTCLYLTIQRCIELKGNSFHLLWGNNFYKQRFLAQRTQLYSTTIYKNSIIKIYDYFICEIFPEITFKNIFRITKRYIKKVKKPYTGT
jgi:hypothetical protein